MVVFVIIGNNITSLVTRENIFQAFFILFHSNSFTGASFFREVLSSLLIFQRQLMVSSHSCLLHAALLLLLLWIGWSPRQFQWSLGGPRALQGSPGSPRGTQVPLIMFSWCNDSIKFDLDAFCSDTEGKKRRIGVEKFSNGSKKKLW